MTGFTVGYDATSANLHLCPRGFQLASYVTQARPGDGIAMTAEQLAANPDILRIAQSPSLAVDEASHADVLDMEDRAADISDVAPWAKDARAKFAAGARPGQRMPAIYFSQGRVHDVANALVAGGVTSGVGFWMANWSITQAQAIADVLSGSGPFPVIGIQFADPGPYDCDVWSTSWLRNRSAAPGTVAAPAGLSHTCHPQAVDTNFAWGTVPGWNGDFHFQVFERGVNTAVVNQQVKGTHAMGIALKPGKAYTWRVSAATPAGKWGSQSFETP